MLPVKKTHDELQDLTETLNAMLIRMDRSLRQQQAFFASASHELKTPLAILRAELEVNLNRRQDELVIGEFLQSQLTEIKRLQERVNAFLVVSQLKEGNLKLYRSSFDLSASVLKVFSQLKPMLISRHLQPIVTFDPERDGYMIHGDEDKIEIILMNVLGNAVNYAVAGTTVICRVGPASDDRISIEMENVISEEQIDTDCLQEAYHRESDLAGGAGIGLWLCGEIARLHGGELQLRSGGYRFLARVELPAILRD
jgi:signal transduction histidine kinase